MHTENILYIIYKCKKIFKRKKIIKDCNERYNILKLKNNRFSFICHTININYLLSIFFITINIEIKKNQSNSTKLLDEIHTI